MSEPALDLVSRGVGSGENETCLFLPVIASTRGGGGCCRVRKVGAHGALAELGRRTAVLGELRSPSPLAAAEMSVAAEMAVAGAPELSKRTTPSLV